MANQIIMELTKERVNEIIKKSKVYRSINYHGIAGVSREQLLEKLLSQYITTNYSIDSGVVINSTGEQSNQTDVIIYNKSIIPPIYLVEGEKKSDVVIPIESVAYAIEVKTTLNRTEINTTIDKFKKLQLMNFLNMTVCFAYNSDLSTKHELERYFQCDAGYKKNPAIRCLCVINKGYYFFRSYKQQNNTVNEWLGVDSDKLGKEVIILLAGISNTLNRCGFGYYLLDGGKFTTYYKGVFDSEGNLIEENNLFHI